MTALRLACLRSGDAAGRLVVVGSGITQCSDAGHVALTLSDALAEWDRCGEELAHIARGLESGGQPLDRFHERDALPPLPTPVGGPAFGDPRGTITVAREGAQVLAGFAALTGPVPAGADRATASAAIRLVALALVVGPAAAPSSTQLSPIAASPAGLGSAWADGRVTGTLRIEQNGAPLPGSAPEGLADLAARVMQAARNAALSAGALVMSMPEIETAVARPGDTIRLELRDTQGHNLLGAIEQRIDGALV